MKYEGKYEVTPDIEALEAKYSQEVDELRIGTPGRTPSRYGTLSRRSSFSSGAVAAARRTGSSPLTKSVPEFALKDLEEEVEL